MPKTQPVVPNTEGSPEPRQQSGTPASRFRRIRSSPWTHLLAALLMIGLLQGFVVKLYAVPSGSMENTLEVNDRIVANRIANTFSSPERGDVVVFNQSEAWDEPPSYTGLRQLAGAVGDLVGIGPSNHYALVKRVIGVPGDTVGCCSPGGQVQINGSPIIEPYIYEDYVFEPGVLDCTTEPISQRCFPDTELREDQYLMLGDHRSRSSDSVTTCRGRSDSNAGTNECVRLALRDDLVGEVLVRIWPLSQIGSV